MSRQFDNIKKVVDGIDRRFIEESADSMLNSAASTEIEVSELIEISGYQKKTSGRMLAGLTAAAAVLVCVVCVSIYTMTRGEDVSIVQSGENSAVNASQTETVINRNTNDNRINFPMNTICSTYDGTYFYHGHDKIDVNNKKILANCDIADCEHNGMSCKASVWANRNAVTAFDGGFYYVEDNRLFYERDDKSKLIVENTYSTKFSEETYKRGDLIYNIILLDNEKLLAVGANYIFTVDTVTKSVGEYIEIGEDAFRDMALSGDIFIANNMNGELFTANIKTGEVKKRKECIYSVQAYGSKVYYVKNDNNKKKLYYSDVDFTSDNYIADDVTEIFATKDKLCYIKETAENILFYRNFENFNDEKVVFTLPVETKGIFTMHYFPDSDMAVVICYNQAMEESCYKIFNNNFNDDFDIESRYLTSLISDLL